MSSADVPTYLERVLTQDGERQFVVVERWSRASMTEEEASECAREARTAAPLEHPNVVRTRAITLRPDEISVTSDYVAGERLSELWSSASGSGATPPLEVALRILVDVATGLGALHKLRSEGQERVKFVHGEVTSSNVLVGLDGVSVLLRSARVRRPNILPRAGIGTLAPEVLSGAAVDQRADIYSLGALLWQALSGRSLFRDDDVDAILASAKEGTVARAVVSSDAPWALPLADVAARALAPAADKRFPTASSMLTELRKIAGPKLATEVEVAKFVQAAAGGKIAARLSDDQASAVIRKATSIPAPPSISAVTTPLEPPSDQPTPPASAVTTPLEAPDTAPTEEPRRPRPSPPAERKPISIARGITGKAAPAVKRSLVVAPASLAIPAPAPTPSPLTHQGTRVVIGASLAIALLTGWFALWAIRNRQEIVTPGAMMEDTAALLERPTAPAPVSSTLRDVAPARPASPRVVAPTRTDPAVATTPPAKGAPAKLSAPHQAPPAKLGR